MDNVWYDGIIDRYDDETQRWHATYSADGDEEEFNPTEMKSYIGPSFECGVISQTQGIVRLTSAQIRSKNRLRRLQGRPDPLSGVLPELADVAAGAEFALAQHYTQYAGTRYKLLRVYHDEQTGRKLAAYCPIDEAGAIPQEDIDQLTLHELEMEYEVEVSEFSKVQAWIVASRQTAEVVPRTAGSRQSRLQRGQAADLV